ncbi:MAG: CBU_0592 family membrane protein [Nocardioidaceae bacterium]
MFDLVQVTGALLVLACFLLAQVDRIEPASYRYLLANLLGSGAMTVTAVVAEEWGFVFLEGVWALVSAWGTVQRLRGVRPGVAL